MPKETLLKIIAWIEIIGGCLGFFLALDTVINGGSLLSYVLIIILFGCSIFSGVMLLKDKEIGYIFSIINQILQIPRISISSIAFVFLAGPAFNVNIVSSLSLTGINFNFLLFNGTFYIMFDNTGGNILLGVNLIAVIILIYLAKKYYEKRKYKNNYNIEC